MQISRDKNVEADALANLASAAHVAINENASVIHLFHSVLDPDKNEVNFNNLTWDWRNEIVAFFAVWNHPLRQEKSLHALEKGCSILFKARQSLSKNVRWTLSKVTRAFTDEICNERDTRGVLRKSRKRKITGKNHD